jgi:hypothetical protein
MIIEAITNQRDSWKQLGAELWVVDEFLLRNGREFYSQLLPVRYRRRPIKACFYNARQLVLRAKGLRYAEGYAIGMDLPLLIHHAWAVDAKDRVIDPTLRQPEMFEFFGIAFDQETIRPKECRYSGVLATDYGWRVDFMNAFDPGIAGLWGNRLRPGP